MFNKKNKNNIEFILKKKHMHTYSRKLFFRFLNKKYFLFKNLKNNLINTCFLTGKKKGFSSKTKLNRHFIRNKRNKNIIKIWDVKSW